MKKSSRKQFQQFQQLKQSTSKRLKKARTDGKKFFKILNKKWLVGLSISLLAFIFFLLPSPGYYQNLHLFWQSTEVKEVDVKVPLFPYPINQTQNPSPILSARSIVVMDTASSVVLHEKNPNLSLLPASTTKIMTAIVALENYSLEQVLTTGDFEKDGQTIDLLTGERMTVGNLLYGLLVASGNDVAIVLAENFVGGQPAFVAAMNQKARELNLENSHFENPSGIDHPNHYSTAIDLARLTSYALKNPVFAQIVNTKKITIWDVSGKIPHRLLNINQLVGNDLGVVGVKTGWTEEAGECLVVHVKKDGREITTVVLGSQDRFGETKELIDWVFENFEWEEVVP